MQKSLATRVKKEIDTHQWEIITLLGESKRGFFFAIGGLFFADFSTQQDPIGHRILPFREATYVETLIQV